MKKKKAKKILHKKNGHKELTAAQLKKIAAGAAKAKGVMVTSGFTITER